jgi:NAD(P)-dependent dehydrogenase (short-subunit alcohol dehydrogenase family)
LITGATGGLGSLLARHLAEAHGARHLLLLSRSGEEAEGAKELRDELESLGASVSIAACDVAERAQLQAQLASIPAEHPLGAVIHAAGALDDGIIESLDAERLQRVFAPKALAAQHLHELTEGADLSAFVLFSSAAGVLGAPGQGNYAAANAFLDGLAQQRSQEGLPASSIAWGLWKRQSALTSTLSEADLARMARAGAGSLRRGARQRAPRDDRPHPRPLRVAGDGLRRRPAAGPQRPGPHPRPPLRRRLLLCQAARLDPRGRA